MSTFNNPNFDPAFRRQNMPLFNPRPSNAPSNPYGGLLDPNANFQSPVTQGNVGGGSTTSGSGSGVGAASGAGTAASKPNITLAPVQRQTQPGQNTQNTGAGQTVSVADIGNANTIAGLIDLSAKVDRMTNGYTKRHMQEVIKDKIAEIRRAEKYEADQAHNEKTRARWADVAAKQEAAFRARGKTKLSTPAPTAAPAAAPMDDYLQALYNGEITPDQYRQLTEGNATPAAAAAPARMAPTPALDQAKGAPRISPSAVIANERARRYAEQLRNAPTMPMPAAEPEAPAPASPAPAATSTPTRTNMGPTTADLYPNGMPGDTPSMSDRFAGTAVGKAALAAGDFTKDLVTMLTPGGNDNNVHHEPYVPYVPAKQGEDLGRFLPTTLRQDNPRLSNQAKLRNLKSTYGDYMHNLQMAYERGSLSSTDFRAMRDAATKNYYLEQDIIEGAISDAAPN